MSALTEDQIEEFRTLKELEIRREQREELGYVFATKEAGTQENGELTPSQAEAIRQEREDIERVYQQKLAELKRFNPTWVDLGLQRAKEDYYDAENALTVAPWDTAYEDFPGSYPQFLQARADWATRAFQTVLVFESLKERLPCLQELLSGTAAEVAACRKQPEGSAVTNVVSRRPDPERWKPGSRHLQRLAASFSTPEA